MLIDGNKIAEKINQRTARAVRVWRKYGKKPQVVVFLVGHNPESAVYVAQKKKKAEELGFEFILKKYPASVGETVLIREIKVAQAGRNVVGCLIQLPLPRKFNSFKILDNLDSELDIDCLTRENLGRLLRREPVVMPPTAGAMVEILRALKVVVSGKRVVVIGAGLLVGRPVALLLTASGATVTVANSRTKNLSALTREADIILTGVGQKNLLTAMMVNKNAIVIDAGFVHENGRAYGDADWQKIHKKGAWVTPTPGGVGPVTVAQLLNNAARVAAEKVKK